MGRSCRPARGRLVWRAALGSLLVAVHVLASAAASGGLERAGVAFETGMARAARLLPAGATARPPCRPKRRCDTTPPSVAITYPDSGATVTGLVEVTGTSSDDVLVSVVSLQVDQGLLVPVVGTAAWSYLLDTAPLSAAAHVLTARATDLAGNVGTATVTITVSSGTGGSSPPPAGGYFDLAPVGQWASLPAAEVCRTSVHYSTWEPRPDNDKRNHIMPDPVAVHSSLAARPRSTQGTYDTRWDTWLLPRVDGQFTGTTDEVFQWAACKWGLPDDLVRAIAVRESTWYQYETYPSGRCVVNFGCGDLFSASTSASRAYCDAVARYGYDYQRDFGTGICPKTFSIVGLMDWQDPAWGAYPDNHNGTFPFNRDSTAFAVDYLGSELRGCYEGWKWWLEDTGTKDYAAGDVWGCVGAWYAGDWHSDAANGYISRVQEEMSSTPWLDPGWPSDKPGCTTYGCPGPDPL